MGSLRQRGKVLEAVSMVMLEEGKILTNKIVSVGLKDHSNAYVSDCKM